MNTNKEAVLTASSDSLVVPAHNLVFCMCIFGTFAVLAGLFEAASTCGVQPAWVAVVAVVVTTALHAEYSKVPHQVRRLIEGALLSSAVIAIGRLCGDLAAVLVGMLVMRSLSVIATIGGQGSKP